MQEYSRSLADAVKRARGELGLTQNQVANIAEIDERTVLNIENYKGNPKLEVLYPLVRVNTPSGMVLSGRSNGAHRTGKWCRLTAWMVHGHTASV